MKQFETFCKNCGRKIIMTYNEKSDRWVPCEPDIFRYVRNAGPSAYVNPDGEIYRGKRMAVDYLGGEWGYQKHRRDCAMCRRRAV